MRINWRRLWWKGRVESASLLSVKSLGKKYENYIMIDFGKKDKEIEMFFETHLNDLDTFFMLLQTHIHQRERKGYCNTIRGTAHQYVSIGFRRVCHCTGRRIAGRVYQKVFRNERTVGKRDAQ